MRLKIVDKKSTTKRKVFIGLAIVIGALVLGDVAVGVGVGIAVGGPAGVMATGVAVRAGIGAAGAGGIVGVEVDFSCSPGINTLSTLTGPSIQLMKIPQNLQEKREKIYES